MFLQRNDEEAVVDRGGTRSMLKTNFEKEELEGKCKPLTNVCCGNLSESNLRGLFFSLLYYIGSVQML